MLAGPPGTQGCGCSEKVLAGPGVPNWGEKWWREYVGWEMLGKREQLPNGLLWQQSWHGWGWDQQSSSLEQPQGLKQPRTGTRDGTGIS